MISTDKIQINPLPFIFNLLSNVNRNSGDEKQQVVGTSWLLSMLGLKHLNLGIISSDDERIYDGKTTKGAADTISFEDSIGTLIIDFTSNPPKQDKTDKIRNTANYIHEKLSINVTPLIICSKECHDSKTFISDVVIMDKNDTDKLIELILDNKTEHAKLLFHNIMNASDEVLQVHKGNLLKEKIRMQK